ncbi:MAG: hypothetical protein ACYTFM_06550 [Planctomycetota bacterium]|jgi:hypothetical protein
MKKGLIILFASLFVCTHVWADDAAVQKLGPLFVMDTSTTLLNPSLFTAGAEEARDAETKTGTDPRDFGNKFMPYYRYTELENNVKTNEVTLFGLYAFTPRIAMTYEWPIFKDIDYSSVMPGPPGGIGGPFPPGGGAPPYSDLSSSGSTTGYGDLILRFFGRPEAWEWTYEGGKSSGSIMPTFETSLPTASDDVLGTDTTIVSPAITVVMDIPGEPPFGLGFFAAMNFYDFDVDKGSAGQDYERYRGRYFWMQPLSKPGPEITDGLYVLTELQPIYDFRADDFSFWVGPELGKIVREGFVVYAKPGVGVDRDKTDRKFTFETGFRYFF